MKVSFIEKVTQIDDLLLYSFSRDTLPKSDPLNPTSKHFHSNAEIFACKSGVIRVKDEKDFCYDLYSGDIALVPAGVNHFKAPEEEKNSVWVSAGILCTKCKTNSKQELFSKVSRLLDSKEIMIFRKKPEFFETMEKMTKKDFFAHIKFASLFCSLAEEIAFEKEFIDVKHKQVNKDIDRLLKIDDYIHTIYNHNISNKKIAEDLFISERQLSRIVLKYYGVPLHTLMMNKRIEVAANLLSTTNCSIEEIVAKTGFNNKQSFFKEFKEHYKTTPLKYRKQFKKES